MAEAAVLGDETGVFTAPPTVNEPPPARKKPGPKPGFNPFNNELAAEEFFALLNDIPDPEWPKSLVYVWRRDPFTDNTNGGREPKYIDVINRAVTERNVKEEHGSGTYKIQLNTNDKYVAHTILTIEDLNYAPHIPPGDWLNNPRNKKWQSWKPIIDKWWKEKLNQVAGPQAVATGDTQALNELTRLVAQLANNPKNGDADKLQSVLIQWALQQTAEERKADRDADSPGKLAELIRAVRELMPAPAAAPAQDNTMLTFLLAELKSSREQQTALMTKLFEMKSEQTKQPDPLAQVKTMTELMTMVSGIMQPAAPKEPWQEVVSELGPKVLDVADRFATGMAMRNSMQRQPQPRPMQPNPGQVVNATAETIMSSSPTPQPQPQPTPEPEGADIDTMQRSILIQVAQRAAMALELGMTGDHFAEQICYKFGGAIYDQFIGSIAKDQLIPQLKSIPDAWALLQPYEGGLQEFVDSFYDFATQEDEDDPKSISQLSEPLKPVAAKKSKKSK